MAYQAEYRLWMTNTWGENEVQVRVGGTRVDTEQLTEGRAGMALRGE